MVNIYGRAAWGAKHVAGFGPAPLPAKTVWLHHSATAAPPADASFAVDAAAVRVLEQIGQDRFGGGISYTFAVTPSGRVFEGHGVDRQGAHTKGLNTTGRAIVLVGNYDTARPTPAQVAAVVELLHYGAASRWWTTPALTGGHRDAPGAATACPGRFAHALLGDINRSAAAPREDPDMQLDDLIPDRYAENLRPLTVADTLGWAAAHAAHARGHADRAHAAAILARDEAFTARQEISALGVEVSAQLGQIRELLTQLAGQGGDPQAFAAQVAADLAARLTD